MDAYVQQRLFEGSSETLRDVTPAGIAAEQFEVCGH
jgi:hypothetical protein